MRSSGSVVSSKAIQKARQMAKRNRTSIACTRCKMAKSKCSDYRPCKQCTTSKSVCMKSGGPVVPDYHSGMQGGKEAQSSEIEVTSKSLAERKSATAEESDNNRIRVGENEVQADRRSVPGHVIRGLNTPQTSAAEGGIIASGPSLIDRETSYLHQDFQYTHLHPRQNSFLHYGDVLPSNATPLAVPLAFDHFDLRTHQPNLRFIQQPSPFTSPAFALSTTLPFTQPELPPTLPSAVESLLSGTGSFRPIPLASQLQLLLSLSILQHQAVLPNIRPF